MWWLDDSATAKAFWAISCIQWAAEWVTRPELKTQLRWPALLYLATYPKNRSRTCDWISGQDSYLVIKSLFLTPTSSSVVLILQAAVIIICKRIYKFVTAMTRSFSSCLKCDFIEIESVNQEQDFRDVAGCPCVAVGLCQSYPISLQWNVCTYCTCHNSRQTCEEEC